MIDTLWGVHSGSLRKMLTSSLSLLTVRRHDQREQDVRTSGSRADEALTPWGTPSTQAVDAEFIALAIRLSSRCQFGCAEYRDTNCGRRERRPGTSSASMCRSIAEKAAWRRFWIPSSPLVASKSKRAWSRTERTSS